MAAQLVAFPLLLRGSQAHTSPPGQQTMQPAEWSSCDLLSDLSPPAECASIGPIAACSLGSPCQRTCCLQINPPASATALQAAESDPYPASTAYPSRIRPYFSQIPSRVLRTKEINNLSCPLLPDCWSEACPAFSQLNCFTYGGWGDPKRFEAWAAPPRRHKNVVFIARYNENLYWLTPLLGLIDELHVWNKGHACRTDVFELLNQTGKLHLTNVQNGGRDGHSFLEFAAQYVERGDAHGLGNVFFIQIVRALSQGCPGGHLGQSKSLKAFQDQLAALMHGPTLPSMPMLPKAEFFMLNPFLINARRVAHLVGSSYRGVDPTGRVSIVGDELKGRLNQTVTNFFSLLDTDPLPWLELGLSPPLRDADRDVKLFTSVMGYTHRIYGAVMRRQRFICDSLPKGRSKGACLEFDNWWSPSGQFAISINALANLQVDRLHMLARSIWDDEDTRDKDLGYVQEATWPLILMNW